MVACLNLVENVARKNPPSRLLVFLHSRPYHRRKHRKPNTKFRTNVNFAYQTLHAYISLPSEIVSQLHDMKAVLISPPCVRMLFAISHVGQQIRCEAPVFIEIQM